MGKGFRGEDRLGNKTVSETVAASSDGDESETERTETERTEAERTETKRLERSEKREKPLALSEKND